MTHLMRPENQGSVTGAGNTNGINWYKISEVTTALNLISQGATSLTKATTFK
jgi:hypothetical protein